LNFDKIRKNTKVILSYILIKKNIFSNLKYLQLLKYIKIIYKYVNMLMILIQLTVLLITIYLNII